MSDRKGDEIRVGWDGALLGATLVGFGAGAAAAAIWARCRKSKAAETTSTRIKNKCKKMQTIKPIGVVESCFRECRGTPR